MTIKKCKGMPGYYEWDKSQLSYKEFLEGIESLRKEIPKDSELYKILNLEKYSNLSENSCHTHKPL